MFFREVVCESLVSVLALLVCTYVVAHLVLSTPHSLMAATAVRKPFVSVVVRTFPCRLPSVRLSVSLY